jgi:hypothetical protein
MKKLKRFIRKTIRKTQKPEVLQPQVFNESVNFDKQCIFIAIPKTGTTSIRSQLKQPGIPLIKNPHLNIVQVRDSLYVYFLKETLGKNDSFPSDSVPSDADIRLKVKEVFENFFKFSSVRNPWARAVSMYSRREGVKIKDNLSFEEFCRNHLYASDTCLHPTLHRNQLDWLCDENGQCIMDYVYRLEDFNKSIIEISELTNGRVQLECTNANQNPDSESRSYRDLYSDETRKLIAKRFEKDIDEFKYTF